ncbi:MAG: hypothetical protein QOG01_4030 [Pseudonocardiales bacterium]|nr:hypothetical protein [Pseudonocardiales bacterium]
MTSRERGGRHGHPVVYLHIGEPKSGTTFLQEVMWGNRAALAGQGVLLPGVAAQDHFRANQDLREVLQAPDDPSGSYHGEWNLLARQALRADHTAVISHELLSSATAEQAARALGSLQGAEVHVVLTVRDFVSLLPAEWQETVKHRNTGTWPRWVGRVMRTEDAAGPSPGPWFWRVHDTLAVLRRWSQGLPPSQVHVVTVPPPGSPANLLWERFASVIGVDPGSVDLTAARPNTSLGLAEAELLRRLNVALGRDSLPGWFYTVHVKERIAHDVLATRPPSLRPGLNSRQEQWARGRAEKVVAGLQESGYDIIGSLDDLLAPPAPPRGLNRPDEVPPEAVLDAAVEALAAALRYEYGRPDRTRIGTAPRAATSLRVKRALRDLTSRHPSIGRLRVLVWRLSERSRARWQRR